MVMTRMRLREEVTVKRETLEVLNGQPLKKRSHSGMQKLYKKYGTTDREGVNSIKCKGTPKNMKTAFWVGQSGSGSAILIIMALYTKEKDSITSLNLRAME